jgi:Mg2+-importing ATPase
MTVAATPEGRTSGASTRLLSLPLETLLSTLNATREGISDAEARIRLARYGFNEPTAETYTTALSALLALLLNPLVAILLLSAVVSGFLGDRVGASIIALMVLLSVALNFILSSRSQHAAARLRDEIVPTATVCRAGNWRELPRRELVPGDRIRLGAGDRVPADARLIDARDLHVQQSALTGESVPVEKEPFDLPDAEASATDVSSSVFLGTSVVAGTANAIVVATGPDTAFGNIAESLAARPPQTEFERGLEQFARLIMRTVFFLVLFVILASLAMGRPAFPSLLFAVALAVGLTPEFMPMIVTVTLARGAVRMAKRRVIVKHLAAIDDFGSMDVLLSDKTGTLTTGEMAVDSSVDACGEAVDRPLFLAYLNSANETGIRSPLDSAILACARTDAAGYRKLDEIPFDFERRRLSAIVADGDEALLVTKGAPESILPFCTGHDRGGETVALDAGAREMCAATYQAMCEQGLRVLAIAYRRLPPKTRYGIADETDLVLAGFVSFRDPPIAGVGDTIKALARDGLAVKILTGDNERVAQHVCTQVGVEAGRIVLGSEIDGLSDIALGALAERSRVFARMLPAQKLRVVVALRQRGHVVGFLGDGINDAPSLHAADVGISVINAVDVARDAADIVLRERDLGVLHEGVIEGRRAFANVMKYLLMGTSSNFGNMFSMAAGVLFLPFLPMLPTQILLNNFLYDLAQVTIPTDNVDEKQLRRPQHWDIGLIRNFMVLIGPISSLYDFLTFYVLLHWLHASAPLFQTGWFVESLATQTLVLFVIRTTGNPLRSRPSLALGVSTTLVVLAALAIPLTPWAQALGFVPLPTVFFAFLALATLTYLVIVEFAKRRLWTVRSRVLARN